MGDAALPADAEAINQPPDRIQQRLEEDRAYVLQLMEQLNRIGMDPFSNRLPDPSSTNY